MIARLLPLHRPVAGVLVVATLVDVATTWWALTHGFVELNPAGRSLIGAAGLAGALGVRVLGCVTVVLAMAYLPRTHRLAPRAVAVFGALVALWWSVVAARNVLVLL